MNNADLLPELTQFIRAVQRTEPLDVSIAADRSLYLPHLQGPRDALGRLRSEINHRDGDGVYLFTGQVGSGKSTELLRLKSELNGPQCKVYYCDLENWLNVNAPIDLSSFLLALMAGWIDSIGTVAGQRSPVQRLLDFFTRTQIDVGDIKLESDFGLVKGQVQLKLQTDARFRAKLEAVLQGNLSGFVTQAHRFASELVAEVCPQGEKCVLIADSLEKIRGYGSDAPKVYESIQRLFLSEGRALAFPGVHAVYSVSPYLLDENPQLATILGQGALISMPSVHVFQKRSTDLDAEGVKQMTELLTLRYAKWCDFIPSDLLTKLIRDSGGDLRDYLRAVKLVLLEKEAVADVNETELLEFVRNQISPPKTLRGDHIAWLATLERSHEAVFDDKVDRTQFNTYLSTKHILAYLNGTTWYALHPLLREWLLNRPEAQATSTSTVQA